MKDSMVSLLPILLLNVLRSARGEFYSSLDQLKGLLQLEGNITEALHEYLNKTEEGLIKLKGYLKDIEEYKSASTSAKDLLNQDEEVELSSSCPLQAYSHLKRWSEVRDLLLPRRKHKAVAKLKKISDDDVVALARIILRIQTVYNLKTKDLAVGNLMGVTSSSSGLRAKDCLFIGKQSFEMGLYSIALEWFEEANGRIHNKGYDDVIMEDIRKSIKDCINKLQNLNKEEQNMKINLLNRIGFDPTLLFDKPDSKQNKKEYFLGLTENSWNDTINFNALCRGEKLLSDEYLSTLNCFYTTRGSSYYKLNPLKVERWFFDPEILLFHDVISDDEISKLKKIAQPRLSRAKFSNVLTGKVDRTDVGRTSEIIFLTETSKYPFVLKINERIEEITGLSTSLEDFNAEPLQIGHYGISGHYHGHYDFLRPENNPAYTPLLDKGGDRIATWMFYLSDVIKGGATVFPRLGASVWPVRGAAVFWHNLKRSGKLNKLTLHGGCPVAFGTKWVSNTWIREKGQFLRRPCSLNAEE